MPSTAVKLLNSNSELLLKLSTQSAFFRKHFTLYDLYLVIQGMRSRYAKQVQHLPLRVAHGYNLRGSHIETITNKRTPLVVAHDVLFRLTTPDK